MAHPIWAGDVIRRILVNLGVVMKHSTVIPVKYVEETCKMGQGKECCRYLGVGSKGWECLKLTTFKKVIDARHDAGEMIAQGDNCGGYGSN